MTSKSLELVLATPRINQENDAGLSTAWLPLYETLKGNDEIMDFDQQLTAE